MKQLEATSLSKYKGFIFDIDGTMIDSMKVHLKAWQKVLEKYGCHYTMKEVGELAYGINPEIVKRALGDHLTDEEIEMISNEKEVLFRESFDPEEDVIKGFIHFIVEWFNKKIPLVIGSAAPSDNIDFFMDRLGIGHYFKGAISEESVTKGKPSPEVFLKAAKLINVPIEQCVVFEDSPSGAEASGKAGSDTIAVLTTKTKKDFDEIPRVVGYIQDYRALLTSEGIETQ
ncbi:MAG TPA: HAD-IA family hydrolase [Saprospiraceae bacterium]|nr:HAD-IA family hydrolase [Saprospiraceae bacterium]